MINSTGETVMNLQGFTLQKLPLTTVVICSLLFIAPINTGQALAPVAPDSFQITQPNGTTITAYPKGNMLASWSETEEGFTIVPTESGEWFYAVKNAEGQLVPSKIAVGSATEADKSALQKGLKPERDSAYQLPLLEDPLNFKSEQGKLGTTQVPMLVVLVNFQDISFTYTTAQFQNLAFGPTNSINEFYNFHTYGQLEFVPAKETHGVANDGMVEVTLAMNHPNFGNNYSAPERTQLLDQAILAANPFINFAAYDTNDDGIVSSVELSIMYIIAGYETAFGGLTGAKTPNVWGHVSSYTSPTVDGVRSNRYTMFGERHSSISNTSDRIATHGIMCHEIGHLTFGLPDLYDYDDSSFGSGKWCLMAHGTWERKFLSGDKPIGFTAWSKIKMGFLQPVDLFPTSGVVTLDPLIEQPEAYRILLDPYGTTQEYFLLENRQKGGVEEILPGTGMLITHIDESNNGNSNDERRLVDIEEADGLNDLDNLINLGDAGDLFPGTSFNQEFSNFTNPSMESYNDYAAKLSINSITEENRQITFNVENTSNSPYAKGNINYIENTSIFNGFGYNQPTAWSALIFTNPVDSPFNVIEGIDVYNRSSGSVQINAYLYERFTNNRLTNLITPLGQFTTTTIGWNRFMLEEPASVLPGQTRVLAIQFNLQQNGFPLTYDAVGQQDFTSYIGFSQGATFTQIPNDLAQYLLMGEIYDLWSLY
ncbi:MAG: M6 family metalloprotease domain-containing protein [Sumerlaeia bacterium]